MIKKFDNLIQLFQVFPDEQSAIDHLTAIRWANGKFCPLCGNADEARIYTFGDRKTHKCADCRKRFSIKVGTIFQDTKLPLRTWFAAVWMITNHPKGIASTTLATDLGITQKSAWFVMHRLRHAALTKSFNAPLEGEVEIDETYVGGKAHNRHGGRSGKGTGVVGKTPVIGAVSRKGVMIARVITKPNTATLDGFVHENVSPKATLVVTDEHAGYRHLNRTYAHQIVRHGKGEYANGAAHTNTIEGAWALLKRQIIGIHHWVSPKHLDRYVQEMTFRYNRREVGQGGRVNALLSQVEGPLPYKVLIA
ncbi:MAG: IS1595 family transposase [Caulobacter sp.]|nr:IS1595 family transposase [Caulobacter sp.]